MSIFKEHKTSADRSATDRSRHKKKIERALREGVYDIVSDESIIGKDGKKKIKIPVKGIKEYRLVYGDNETNKKVGSAPGKDVRKGQVLKRKNNQQGGQGGQGGKPGNDEGEESYEVEVTLDELASYLFESLKLPDLDKKKMKTIVSSKRKRSGYRKAGIRSRLSKKRTLINKIKRKKHATRVDENRDSEQRFPFHKDDLTYRHIKEKPKENDSAVIFFIMDVSGSMTQNKKFIARSFFFLLYHFLRYRYEKVEIVFISHTSTAKEVSEEDFFSRASSGGTYISSGTEKCLEIIEKRYHPSFWNIYAFHGSDGDNWPEDIEKSKKLFTKLSEICQMSCFLEIVPEDKGAFWIENCMSSILRPIESAKFKVITVRNPEQIWPNFKRLFGGKIDV